MVILGPIAPGRVLQRLFWRDVFQGSRVAIPEGSARGGQQQAAYAFGVRLLALQALPDGAVLAVDW